MNTSNRFQLTVFSSVFALGVLLVLPMTTQAAGCQFARDLQLGVMSPEVKCLQQYLNGNGFKISETGAGSVGKETDEYKLLTEAAVIKWQKANAVSPASGYFGSKSRAKYVELTSGKLPEQQVLGASTSTVAAGSMTSLEAQVAALMSQLTGVKAAAVTTTAPSVLPSKSVMGSLKDALDAIVEAENAIDDNPKADDIDEANDNVVDARNALYKALRALIANDVIKAQSLFNAAAESADDATSLLEKKASDLSDRLDELRSDLKSAQKKVTKADNNDDDIGDAQDYLDNADDYLDVAETAIDDEDDTRAKKYLDKAETAIEDALDEL